MAIQEDILDFMKQKIFPEIQQLSSKIVEVDRGSRERDAQLAAILIQMQADMKVMNGRMDRLEEKMLSGFEQVDKRFEQVDKCFEQVDKRFEQVDKRFEQVEASIRDLNDDVREIRSLMFVGKAQQMGYAVREK